MTLKARGGVGRDKNERDKYMLEKRKIVLKDSNLSL